MKINPNVIRSGLEFLKSASESFMNDPKARKTVFGTYSNGKPRSIIDALNGEVIHPEDKLLIAKKIEKNKKKRKKKKKKQQKAMSEYLIGISKK